MQDNGRTLEEDLNRHIKIISLIFYENKDYRLWFLLRVVPLPDEWLSSIQTAVATLALPFWPKPSWRTICLPRRQGGLGIVDIRDQALALQMVYLRGMTDTFDPADFLTP
ncbi:hypothetical protein BD560DRAFT_441161 [Blakeslea trispora]|nr:hypothetical protein BD560DRAFT_441161 [Blakeslea trispora]